MKNLYGTSFSRIGAHELKANYQRNMLVSTILTAAIALAAALFFTSDNSEATPVGPPPKLDTIYVHAVIPATVKIKRKDIQPVANRSHVKSGIPIPVADDELPPDFDDRPIATKDELVDLVDGQFASGDIGDGNIVVYEQPTGNEYPKINDFQSVEIYPKMIYEKAPVYPRLARTASMEADVWIKALVDVDGTVVKAVVYKSSGANLGFDQAAVEAALLCRYSPGIQNGIPVPVWVCYKVEFRLKD